VTNVCKQKRVDRKVQSEVPAYEIRTKKCSMCVIFSTETFMIGPGLIVVQEIYILDSADTKISSQWV
jgi:hypothetical protein